MSLGFPSRQYSSIQPVETARSKSFSFQYEISDLVIPIANAPSSIMPPREDSPILPNLRSQKGLDNMLLRPI